MKKIYQAPETTEVKIALQPMLAGSPSDVTLNKADGQVTGSEDIGSRHSGGLWDDDED